MHDQQASVLRIPLYKLLYLEEVPELPLTSAELEQFYRDYEPDEVQQIIEGLVWAHAHPDYPYSSLLPGIKLSNKESYIYLMNLLQQIKRREASGLS